MHESDEQQSKDTFDDTPVVEDSGLERAVIKAVSDDLLLGDPHPCNHSADCEGCFPMKTVATFPVLCTEDCQREKDALRQLLEAHVLEEKRIRKGIARAHCATCTKPYDRCSLCQLAGRYATEES